MSSGDGGNDVSMIQAANAGVGIEGKVRDGARDHFNYSWRLKGNRPLHTSKARVDFGLMLTRN